MSGVFTKIDKQIAEGRAVTDLQKRAAYEHGTESELPSFYRYVVLETIFDPTIVDANKLSYFEHVLGVSNVQFGAVLPRNTIVARRVLDSTATVSTPAMFLFPFFPPSLSLPCQAGEHVWVMFENQTALKNDMGYWFCRIVEPGFVEDVNHTHAPRANDPSFLPGIKSIFDGDTTPAYEFRNGRAGERDGERYTIAESATTAGGEETYERLLTETDCAKVNVLEPVPRFRKRPSDVALEGSNNTLIVLGRDRTSAAAKFKVDDASGATVADGIPDDDAQGVGSGAIDMVVGRGQTDKTSGNVVESTFIAGGKTGFKELGKSASELVPGEGDVDLKNDRSRVMLAQRSNVDKNFQINGVIESMTPNSTVKDDASGCVVVKTDKARIIAREDIVIMVVPSTSKDQNGNIADADADVSTCAAIILRSNGDVIIKPADKGVVKLGGDDANLAVLCTSVNNGGAGGQVTASPIVDTMLGAQGQSDGLNGTFSKKVLLK